MIGDRGWGTGGANNYVHPSQRAPGGERITGAERLCDDPSLLRLGGKRLGLLTNHTGAMPDLSRNVESFRAAGLPLTVLFGPEHGLMGSAQAGSSESDGIDELSSLPVVDLYGRVAASLEDALRDSGVTGILVDLQEVGVRFYTYIWSLFDLMVSAARLHLPVTVLDRPNPLSFLAARGPGLLPEYVSFVGRASIPLIHGQSIGELAVRFNQLEIPQQAGRPVELDIIRMENWDRREMTPHDQSLWVPPSPNLPTPLSALAYAATCLFEGTNVSEGRGTTHPFEWVGAGFMDGRFAHQLRDSGIPGVLFREHFAVPAFGKWRGRRVRGVQMHICDPLSYDPVLTGVTMLSTAACLYPDRFRFLRSGGRGGRHFIDLLWGSAVLRQEPSAPLSELISRSPAPVRPSAEASLYD